MAVKVEQVQKPLYRTSDGKEFEDEGAAMRHEVEIQVDAHFTAFRDASGYAEKAYNCILAWELHKEGLLKRKGNGAAPEPPESVLPTSSATE